MHARAKACLSQHFALLAPRRTEAEIAVVHVPGTRLQRKNADPCLKNTTRREVDAQMFAWATQHAASVLPVPNVYTFGLPRQTSPRTVVGQWHTSEQGIGMTRPLPNPMDWRSPLPRAATAFDDLPTATALAASTAYAPQLTLRDLHHDLRLRRVHRREVLECTAGRLLWAAAHVQCTRRVWENIWEQHLGPQLYAGCQKRADTGGALAPLGW